MAQKWKLWDWYSVLFDLAADPVFQRDDLNGIQSIQETDFWDAFIYLGKKSDYSEI